MINDDYIVLTLTSWHKRIDNVKNILADLCKQTILPDYIILNLCIQDFPNLINDLPEDLLEYIDNAVVPIEIYWYIENYKSFKKYVHTIDIANPNWVIITADDDHIYERNFIEKMYKSYLYYDKKCVVIYNKDHIIHNMLAFYGPGTLFCKRFLPDDYKKYLTYDVLHKCNDDLFMPILCAIKGTMIAPNIYKSVPDIYMQCDTENGLTTGNVDESIKIAYRDSTIEVLKKVFKDVDDKYRYNPGWYGIVWDMYEHIKTTTLYNIPQIKYLVDLHESEFLNANTYNITADDMIANNELK